MTLDTLGSYVTGTTYDAAGRITNRNLGNGTAIANTYNPWTLQGGRLANILAVQSGITRQSLGYTYDVMGNITQIADGLGLTTNYTNDALNRLDTTTESSKNNPEYDALTGNLANLNGTNPSTQYGYNDPEHLHAVTHIGGILKYMYDANGNMTQRPNQTLQYNPENQLTAVTGTPSASFVYDGDGNRVLSTINGVTTAYIGNHTEWNVTAQEMTRYYLAGSQRVAFRIIKSGQPDRLYYLLSDHLGSSNVVMQVGGGVETQTYTAWGELRTGGITTTQRQYTGQINESSLGLYFYNARWYDSALGRFISADSIVPFESQGVQAFDRFAYTNNNPLRYVDPSGHDVGCAGVDAAECQGRRGYWRAAPPYRQPIHRNLIAGIESIRLTTTTPQAITTIGARQNEPELVYRAGEPKPIPPPSVVTPTSPKINLSQDQKAFLLDRASDVTSIIPVALQGLQGASPSIPWMMTGGGFSAWAQWERDEGLVLQRSTRIYRSLVVGGESIIVSTISSAFALVPGAAGGSFGPAGAIAGFSIGYTSAYSTLFGMIDNDQLFNWLELNQ